MKSIMNNHQPLFSSSSISSHTCSPAAINYYSYNINNNRVRSPPPQLIYLRNCLRRRRKRRIVYQNNPLPILTALSAAPEGQLSVGDDNAEAGEWAMQDFYSLRKDVETATKRVEEIRISAGVEHLEEEVAALESSASDNSFWDDRVTAKQTLAALNDVKDRIKLLSEFKTQVEDAETIVMLTEEMDSVDVPLLEEARTIIRELNKGLDKFELTQLLSGQYDKEGAIVNITAGAGGTDAQGSMVYSVAFCYDTQGSTSQQQTEDQSQATNSKEKKMIQGEEKIITYQRRKPRAIQSNPSLIKIVPSLNYTLTTSIEERSEKGSSGERKGEKTALLGLPEKIIEENNIQIGGSNINPQIKARREMVRCIIEHGEHIEKNGQDSIKLNEPPSNGSDRTTRKVHNHV